MSNNLSAVQTTQVSQPAKKTAASKAAVSFYQVLTDMTLNRKHKATQKQRSA